jgi:tetratricopeptide (TPR) repeat protein
MIVTLAIVLCVPALAADPLAEARALNQQAIALYRQARYAEAESLFKIALNIREKTLGPDHPEVAQSLNNLALLYKVQSRYAEAKPLYERALAIREKALGPDHPDVATVLNNLAALYQGQSLYAEAEPLHKRALAIREKALGVEHPDVAVSLNNLAGLYDAQGRYAEAEPLYKRALAIREGALGPDHPEFGATLNSLAGLYRQQARYAEAEPLYKRALAIREKTFGPDHPDVAATLDSLAGLYRRRARYAEAEPLYKRALAIEEKAVGPDHPDVATALNNLALLYREQARYAEAEPLYKRALAIREKTLGVDHAEVAQSVNNLAVLYNAQGRYAEAEPLYKRSLAIRNKALGAEHPDVAQSADNLAALYQAQGHYADAERCYKQALAIWEKALGPDHPDFATGLNNLAGLYEVQGLYAAAEPLFKRALTIRENALGSDHPIVAQSENNLAGFYSTQGHYAEAEPLYERALMIWEKALGPDHPDVATSLNNLAALYAASGRFDRALASSARAVEILMKHLSIGSGRRSAANTAEQHSNRSLFVNYVGISASSAANFPDPLPETAVQTFRVAQMAQISAAGTAIAGMAARIAAGGGRQAEIIRERQDLVQRRQQLDGALIKAVGHRPAERRPAEEASLRVSLEDTTRQLDKLDAQIAAEFPAYAELSNPKPLTAESAQALLGRDEALLLYLITDKATWVWVVRRDSIAFRPINVGAKALADEVTTLRQSLDPELNPNLQPFPASRAYTLYKTILAPAQSNLRGVRHLLIVPDGALERLPFSVLVTNPPTDDPEDLEGHREVAWLARDFAVTVLPSVSSLRSLRQFANTEHASASFLGIGDPVLQGGARRGEVPDISEVRTLDPLPESAKELRAIANAMGASDDDLLLGERASGPVIRQTPLERYRVIHFATHGLVSGGLKGLTEPALVLTPPPQAAADNDGLLTASEIATLKLNADWVILSACNTAAGDGTSDTGGLSGLARAFFYAGARALLVSHWRVLSGATVRLIIGTFAALAEDPSIGRAEALRRSMIAMLAPPSAPEFAHPAAWAPFVVAGEGGTGR